MKPTLGRIVMARGGRAVSNGAQEAPAMITRVWGEAPDRRWTVNATIFPDATDPRTVTSVYLYETAEDIPADLPPSVTSLHWPARA